MEVIRYSERSSILAAKVRLAQLLLSEMTMVRCFGQKRSVAMEQRLLVVFISTINPMFMFLVFLVILYWQRSLIVSPFQSVVQ